MPHKPLNILIANSSRKWIGEAAHTMMLCREFKERGHRVWLVCRRGWELEKRARDVDYCTLIPLHFSSRFHIVHDVTDALTIRRIVTREHIDIVHVHRGKEHWLAAAGLSALRNAPPLVRTRHVVIPLKQHIFNQWLYKKNTDAVISVSNKARESLGSLTDYFTMEHTPVIYAAVDTAMFNPEKRNEKLREQWGVGSDELLVGLVARFQGIKGQMQFLQAAQRILHTTDLNGKVKFLLAGRGARRKKPKFERIAHQLGISQSVVIIDESERIPELLASLDIGVVASLGSEASSRITLEYMASGVPVVASAVGGIPELVTHDETAFLVEPGNIKELADAVLRFINSTDLRTQFAQHGLKKCKEFFTPERFVSEIETLYYTLIRGTG